MDLESKRESKAPISGRWKGHDFMGASVVGEKQGKAFMLRCEPTLWLCREVESWGTGFPAPPMGSGASRTLVCKTDTKREEGTFGIGSSGKEAAFPLSK